MWHKWRDGWDCEWLKEQYADRGLTMAQVAGICGCTASSISLALKNCGIQNRPGGVYTDRVYKHEDWLREQYEHLTTTEMAEMCGVTGPTIRYWMEKFGIRRRCNKNYEGLRDFVPGPEWLREHYWTDGLSLRQIAKLVDASSGQVWGWMMRHDIPRRPKPGDQYPDADQTYRNEQWLYDQYAVQGLTQQEIADHIGVGFGAIHRWMRRCGIETRTPSERNTRQAVWVNEDGSTRPRHPGEDSVLRQNLRDKVDALRLVEFHIEHFLPGWIQLLDKLQDEVGVVRSIEVQQALQELQTFKDAMKEREYREDGHRLNTGESRND